MSIAQVRTIISDPEQFDRATATGDGSLKDFEVPHKPVVALSDAVDIGGTSQTRGTDYTIDNGIGLITFTAAPANAAVIAIKYRHTLLSDTDIQTFLDLNDANVRYAAADALETIASNEALVQKKITSLDVSTDGPAVAKALRDHAKNLREQAAFSEDAAGAIDWAEMVFDDFTYREKLSKEGLRGL